jgi:hypothetical protein
MMLAHDFDFLLGQWRIRHRRLRKRGNGSTAWDEFETTQIVRPILNGFGNEDGTSFRLFDPGRNQWSLFAIDGCRGVLGPATGTFVGDTGVFEGPDAGRPRSRVRFVWSRRQPLVPRWERSFSQDGGRTWETNWVMDFTRIRPVNVRVIA